MSLQTISTKRARVYHRVFDHDEARRLRREGMTYTELASRFGVSQAAVRRVCDPDTNARMLAQTLRWARSQKTSCKGRCGRRVWAHSPKRSGFCATCLAEQRTRSEVRPTELRCRKCEVWKPDEEFPTYAAVKSRRGRNAWCRACNATARREYRRRHLEKEREATRRQKRNRREQIVATTYVVLRPNGSGYVEHSRVPAGSPAHAIEQAADEAGEYIAVAEGKFQVMTVAPVQAFRVVPKA